MKHINVFENFSGRNKIRIGSLEHLNRFGDYDSKEKVFNLEIGSNAYMDYMDDFFDGHFEDDELSDAGYEQWINDVEAAVKEFYDPEAVVQLY